MAAILPAMATMHEPTLLILTALAGTDRHGYGVITEVERLSDGRLRLSAGTLYRALDRLVGEGLVTSAGEEIVDGRLRRYYRLTDDGAGTLAEEAERMRIQAETVLAELGKAGRRPAAAEPAEPATATKPAKPRTAAKHDMDVPIRIAGLAAVPYGMVAVVAALALRQSGARPVAPAVVVAVALIGLSGVVPANYGEYEVAVVAGLFAAATGLVWGTVCALRGRV
jgi:DNA-binding PadR family transcriptional regulator